MTDDTPAARPPHLRLVQDGEPEPQQGRAGLDLFVVFPGYIPVRDGLELMERPCFSLTKSKRTKPIYHEDDKGSWIRVTADPELGMATIWDADIPIWAVSQLVEARDRGRPIPDYFPVKPYDMLKFRGRIAGGLQYQNIEKALRRLHATRVETNIRQGNSEECHRFAWVSELSTKKVDGELVAVRFAIAPWLREMALAERVLTMDRRYFGLTSGIDRWLYRLARKHMGQQGRWECGFDKLHTKSGTTQQPRDFKRELREAEARDALPGIHMERRRGADRRPVMVFTRRED